MQGIQSFIFQTNKLKEIAGASELVEQICTAEFARGLGKTGEELKTDPDSIVTAAGNIKYVFDDGQQCRNVVKIFPKKMMEFAPGITISQAVVELPDDEEPDKSHFDQLERKLRVQRNKPFRPFDVGLMAVNRSRKTGLPAVEERSIKKEITIIDKGTACKLDVQTERVLNSFFNEIKKNRIPYNMEDITHSGNKDYSWLAIVHADGNNMGLKMQEMAGEIQKSGSVHYGEKFRQFSLKLDEATRAAAQNAYKETIKKIPDYDNYSFEPCRPIVIGGDDLTVIIRADLALDFTKEFLSGFETETEKRFAEMNIGALKNGLTACAGISFIKNNYPFHYGYQLAETLCEEAKKRAKEGLSKDDLTPSCLMFHKVQDSFIEDYKEIRNRELKAGDIRFDFGPYYLKHNSKPTITHLQECLRQLKDKEGNAIKSHLRQWLTDLHNKPELAEQKKLRLISLGNQQILHALNLGKKDDYGWTVERQIKEKDESINKKFSPVYDWLTIHSINQGGD